MRHFEATLATTSKPHPNLQPNIWWLSCIVGNIMCHVLTGKNAWNKKRFYLWFCCINFIPSCFFLSTVHAGSACNAKTILRTITRQQTTWTTSITLHTYSQTKLNKCNQQGRISQPRKFLFFSHSLQVAHLALLEMLTSPEDRSMFLCMCFNSEKQWTNTHNSVWVTIMARAPPSSKDILLIEAGRTNQT